MNRRQSKTASKAKAIVYLFNQHEEAWKGNELLEEALDKLQGYIAEINGASYTQVEKVTKGYTGDKKKFKMQMISIALDVISRIRPYAIKIGNNELLVAIDFSYTNLSQVKEYLSVNRCKAVLNTGREYLGRLTRYKLQENDLENLDKAIASFLEASSRRDIVNSDRVSATKRLAQVIPLIRSEIEILDDLVRSLMPEDFTSVYFNLK